MSYFNTQFRPLFWGASHSYPNLSNSSTSSPATSQSGSPGKSPASSLLTPEASLSNSSSPIIGRLSPTEDHLNDLPSDIEEGWSLKGDLDGYNNKLKQEKPAQPNQAFLERLIRVSPAGTNGHKDLKNSYRYYFQNQPAIHQSLRELSTVNRKDADLNPQFIFPKLSWDAQMNRHPSRTTFISDLETIHEETPTPVLSEGELRQVESVEARREGIA